MIRNPVFFAFFLLSGASFLSAQNPEGKQAPLPHPTETMVVVGSARPVPLAESTASVTVLPVAGQTLAVQSFEELLRQDASVQLQQRGGGGGQADLILRGGSFEQTLVMVNGFRVNDAQAAHHNLDLPMPLEALESIQVLHGAGSTLHGADALSGVVDFLTAAPSRDELRLRGGAGNLGVNEESLLASLVRDRISSRLTAARDFSTGFIADRDYRNESASLENWLASPLGTTDVLLAMSDRSFGANQFYGNYNSQERTKAWFASIRQELGTHDVAAFGYRRHSDEFVLLRTNPGYYENNHTDASWQSSVRHTLAVEQSSILLFGLEADGDSIHSSNLGMHARNRGAGYADLDLHPAQARWSLSAGIREELYSGGLDSAFAPHLAGALQLPHAVKLRASGGYGFRLPTYTDLYYKDAATHGNANLKPESAWSGEAGADWTATAKLSLSATGFYNRQHQTIDYVRASSASAWQAVNLSGLRFAGIESHALWSPARGQHVEASWTQLFGSQAELYGLTSRYALNYPLTNLRGRWSAQLGKEVEASTSVAMLRIYQQPGVTSWNAAPYAVWDAAASRPTGRIRPYLRLSNLSNTGYQEISGVLMPGRAITGGVSIWLSR